MPFADGCFPCAARVHLRPRCPPMRFSSPRRGTPQPIAGDGLVGLGFSPDFAKRIPGKKRTRMHRAGGRPARRRSRSALESIPMPLFAIDDSEKKNVPAKRARDYGVWRGCHLEQAPERQARLISYLVEPFQTSFLCESSPLDPAQQVTAAPRRRSLHRRHH